MQRRLTIVSPSSAPGSPASAPPSPCAVPASTTSSSSSAPATSAAPGVTTPTRAASATCRRTSTRSRSPRTRSGPRPTRCSASSATTSAARPTTTACCPTSASTRPCSTCAGTRPRRGGTSRLGNGDHTADVMIMANGPLSEPKLPDVPGLERFTGTTFHSAAWDHDHDLAGERVAVIGTGASAIQFVPHVQQQAGEVVVFQRTPPWVLPHPNRRIRAWERRAVPAGPRAAAPQPVGVLLAAGDGDPRVREAAPADAPRRACRAPPSRAPGARPRAAGAAHASLPPRLQAAAAVERLVPSPVAAQRPGRDRRHRRGAGAIDRHS